MKRNENGFSAVEVVLVLVIVGLIGVVGFMVYKNHNKTRDGITTANTTKASTTTQPKTATQTTTDTQKPTTQLGIGSLATVLPDGWSADNSICNKDVYSCYTKTLNGKTYVLAFMYKDVTQQTNTGTVTGLTVNDSINPYDSNSVIKTVTTSKGTTLYVVRSGSQTEGKLVASSAKPNPTNAVVPFGAYKLGISVGIGTGQSVAGIDFSANGASEITDDFVSIVSSLNL